MLRPRFKIPLHVLITVPFVLQVVGIVALVGYLSYRSGEKSVQELVDRLAIGITENVQTHLTHYLNQAQSVNQMNLKAIESGTIDLNDFEGLGDYFADQVERFGFDFVNFGGVDGSFIGAGYSERSEIEVAEILPSDPNLLYAYRLSETGARAQLITKRQNPKVNQAAWYTEAIGTDRPLWSSIYTWGDHPNQISISASQSVHDAQGNLRGVLGIDLKLEKISFFLKDLSQSNEISIFILERSGTLVASSSHQPITPIRESIIESIPEPSEPIPEPIPEPVNEGTATRLAAIQSEDPIVQPVTQFLLDRFGHLDRIEQSQMLRPTVNDRDISPNLFINVAPFQDPYGLNWLVVTVISEDQFMTTVRDNGQKTLLFCGLALVSSIGFGALTSRRISRSLGQLQQGIQALVESNFQIPIPNSSIQEVNQLSHGFSVLAQSLQEAQALQKNYQNTLKAEVEIKTAELTEAQTIAQVGSWSFNTLTGKTHWSKELYHIYEVEKSYFCENPHLDIQHIYEVDQDKYQQKIVNLFDRGEPFDCDLRIVTQKGNIRYVQAKGRPVFDDQGRLISYRGTIADISDRKNLEIALADSQKQLSEVLDTAIVGIIRLRFYCDGYLEYDYISPHCEKIFGFPVEDLMPNPGLWQSRIHPEDWKTIVLPTMKGILQQQDLVCSRTMEYRFYQNSGEIVWILANCFCQWNDAGNYWNVTVVDTDISDRKKLELTLKLSETKLENILNSLSAIVTHVWVYPEHWEIDYVSAGAEKISGYTHLELKKPDLWISRIVSEDWDKIKDQVFEDIFAERSGTYEYRFRRKDDQICWIAQTNHSYWDETQKAWSLTIITMDICDRKEAEFQLQSSKEVLSEAQRIAHIGNWSFDLETQKICWSEELFRMFGLDPKQPEPSYAEYLDFIAPPDRSNLQEKINLAIREGQPYLIDYKAILPNGEIRFHEGRGEVERDAQGNIIRLKGTGLDITDRKIVELELTQRTEELDRFFSVALDLLCIASPGGYFIRLNPQWKKTLGYSLAKLEGSRFLDYVHPDDIPNTLKAIQQIQQDGVLPNFVNRYRCRQGLYRWLEWRSVKVDNLIYAAARDITEQKQAQEQLQQAKDRAEALTRAKSEFLANMSHEIRTPLSSVISLSDLLATSNLDREQQDLVQALGYSSNTLLRVLNDVLDFSKIESGELTLEKNPLSLTEEIASILKLFEISAHEKRIILRSSIPIDFPTTLIGDSARLRQILLNLVSNAIKFTETGSIWVIIRERSFQTPDQSPISNDRYELLFSIQDTGIGIQPQQLEKLFAPFSQGDTSISRKYGGTGLGLVISQRLVELMGGTLWVESAGRIAGSPPPNWQPAIDSVNIPGSTFYFTIALEHDRNAPQTQPDRSKTEVPDQSFAAQNPLVILLADDNVINRKVIQFSFKKLGYLIDTVTNGREALEAVQQKPYDLVLMDMQMPEMDGLTATKLIRATPIKQPWIMALTANVLSQDRQACFEVGMNSYETKPLKLEKIRQICQDLARRVALQ